MIETSKGDAVKPKALQSRNEEGEAAKLNAVTLFRLRVQRMKLSH